MPDPKAEFPEGASRNLVISDWTVLPAAFRPDDIAMLTGATELDRTRFLTLSDALQEARARAADVALKSQLMDFLYSKTRYSSISRGDWEEQVRIATALDENITRRGSAALLREIGQSIDRAIKAKIKRQLTSAPTVAVCYHGGFSVPRRKLFARMFPEGVVIAASGKHAAHDGAFALFAAREAVLDRRPALMSPDGRFGREAGTINVLGAQLPVTEGAPFLAHTTNAAVVWFALLRKENGFTLEVSPGPQPDKGERFSDFRDRFYRFYVDRLEEAFTGDPSNLPLSVNWKLTFGAMLAGKVYRQRRPTRSRDETQHSDSD